MEAFFNQKSLYSNLLNLINKRLSFCEILIIMKKQHLTDNTLYYFLCILFRFIHIISFCGGYNNLSNGINSSLKQYVKTLTLFNVFHRVYISFKFYIIIDLIILILFIFRIMIFAYISKNVYKNKIINEEIFLNKLQIIMEHISFLFFSYIIEYLSFIYYIIFIPDKFIIQSINNNIIILIIIIIMNSILIIIYNIENYINIICSNKILQQQFLKLIQI